MTYSIDTAYAQTFLLNLLNTPSPTGNTETAIELVETAFKQLGLSTRRTAKGALVATFPGKATQPARAVTAHVDTLGGMVKEIKPNGRLGLSPIGGYYPGSVLGEYCTVETITGKCFSGTALLEKQSVHIHKAEEIHNALQKITNLEIRLDERVSSKTETEALGIQVGDFISWDTRTQATPGGFIKSRHLDDKAGVAIMLATAQAMARQNLIPAQTTHFYVSTYEEVGHGGASGFPAGVTELVVIDMGVVGQGQTGDEYSVSICAQDSSGPYDLKLRRQLVALAEAAQIPYHLDLYVNYGSDGSAALRAGYDVRVALIGPGVDSSHAYERTHMEAVKNSARLLMEFLLKD